MAYREVTMLEVKEVLRLWLGGAAHKRIAAQLGLNVKTVRRYVAAARASGVVGEAGPEALDDGLIAAVVSRVPPPRGRPRSDGWADCAAQRALIERFLRQGVRLSKLRKLLRRQGVDVSYATLRRFAIAELGFGGTAATIPVADCGPGEEVQLDTSTRPAPWTSDRPMPSYRRAVALAAQLDVAPFTTCRPSHPTTSTPARPPFTSGPP